MLDKYLNILDKYQLVIQLVLLIVLSVLFPLSIKSNRFSTEVLHVENALLKRPTTSVFKLRTTLKTRS